MFQHDESKKRMGQERVELHMFHGNALLVGLPLVEADETRQETDDR